MGPSRFRSQSGLTLLELLVTMAVTALIVAVLGGVLRLASRAWERGEEKLEGQQQSRDLVGLLSEELRSAYPYQVKEKEGETPVYFFEGSEGRVRFVSALSDPSLEGEAPLRLVTIFVEPGRGLLVRSTPVRGRGLPEERPGAAQLLSSRVREVHLRYLAPEGWTASWEPKKVPPGPAPGGRPGSGQAAGAPGPEPVRALPRAVEVSITLVGSQPLGPLTVPVLAAIELKKANPAGRPSS